MNCPKNFVLTDTIYVSQYLSVCGWNIISAVQIVSFVFFHALRSNDELNGFWWNLLRDVRSVQLPRIDEMIESYNFRCMPYLSLLPFFAFFARIWVRASTLQSRSNLNKNSVNQVGWLINLNNKWNIFHYCFFVLFIACTTKANIHVTFQFLFKSDIFNIKWFRLQKKWQIWYFGEVIAHSQCHFGEVLRPSCRLGEVFSSCSALVLHGRFIGSCPRHPVCQIWLRGKGRTDFL